MIIYNIGLPRTGTKSIAFLLKKYGFKFRHPNLTFIYDFEYNYVINNIHLWKMDNYVYSNTPIWHPEFWDLLNIMDHKIIYTYRDKESWIKSIENYTYFKKTNLLKRDKYWFKDYFKGFCAENLSEVYDKHLKAVKQLKNTLYVNIINEDNVEITKKICNYLNIKFNPNIIIENNDKKWN